MTFVGLQIMREVQITTLKLNSLDKIMNVSVLIWLVGRNNKLRTNKSCSLHTIKYKRL